MSDTTVLYRLFKEASDDVHAINNRFQKVLTEIEKYIQSTPGLSALASFEKTERGIEITINGFYLDIIISAKNIIIKDSSTYCTQIKFESSSDTALTSKVFFIKKNGFIASEEYSNEITDYQDESLGKLLFDEVMTDIFNKNLISL